MRGASVLLAMLGAVAHAQAADITAGEEKAEVCAACHGANGVSVSGDIAEAPSLERLDFFASGAQGVPLATFGVRSTNALSLRVPHSHPNKGLRASGLSR